MTRNWKLSVLAAALVCVYATPAAAQETPLLVGGSAASAQAWPSIAFLEGRFTDSGGGKRAYHCTGSVIAPTWIVTAAHCAFGNPGQSPDSMDVILGVSDYTDAKRQVISVDRFVPNPSYDSAHMRGDVALLHLAQPTSAPAIRLATTAESDGGSYRSDDGVPNAAGWGAVDEDGKQFTTELQQAYLPIQSAADCSGLVSGFDPSTQTCAGGAGRATACFGDSGGPLVKTDASNGQPVLWGVTSYRASPTDGGAPCALTTPAVYTWLPAFADFIQSTLSSPVPAGPAAPPSQGAVATPAGDAGARGGAAARRCTSARRALTAARKTERKRRRQLRAARHARVSSVLRGRIGQRTRRHRVAQTRRIRAAATVRRVCAETS